MRCPLSPSPRSKSSSRTAPLCSRKGTPASKSHAQCVVAKTNWMHLTMCKRQPTSTSSLASSYATNAKWSARGRHYGTTSPFKTPRKPGKHQVDAVSGEKSVQQHWASADLFGTQLLFFLAKAAKHWWNSGYATEAFSDSCSAFGSLIKAYLLTEKRHLGAVFKYAHRPRLFRW